MKIARIPVSSLPKGPVGFVKWVRMAHPQVYRRVAAQLAASGHLGAMDFTLSNSSDPVATAAAQPGIGQQIVNTISDLVKVGLPIYQQNQLFDAQLKRAKAGLAPLDTTAISDASAFRVGVDSSTKSTALMVGGLLAGGLLLAALLKR